MNYISVSAPDPARLFAGLLNPRWVTDALRHEGAHWRDGGVYSPVITLWSFLGQVLHPDHSCRAAVARLNAHLVAYNEAPCAPQTGPYCKARRRLPLGVLQRKRSRPDAGFHRPYKHSTSGQAA